MNNLLTPTKHAQAATLLDHDLMVGSGPASSKLVLPPALLSPGSETGAGAFGGGHSVSPRPSAQADEPHAPTPPVPVTASVTASLILDQVELVFNRPPEASESMLRNSAECVAGPRPAGQASQDEAHR
jgi:hypothetical protein